MRFYTKDAFEPASTLVPVEQLGHAFHKKRKDLFGVAPIRTPTPFFPFTVDPPLPFTSPCLPPATHARAFLFRMVFFFWTPCPTFSQEERPARSVQVDQEPLSEQGALVLFSVPFFLPFFVIDHLWGINSIFKLKTGAPFTFQAVPEGDTNIP